MKISGRQRKGISPIIATVLIIAATLIAFAAVAGYIFGLFGSSTKSAQAQVVSSSLTASGGVLTVSFTNSGGQSVTVTTATATIGSATWTAGSTATSPTTAGYTAGTASAGSASVVAATTSIVWFNTWYETGGSASNPFVAGTTYTFTLALSNGITSTITVTAS